MRDPDDPDESFGPDSFGGDDSESHYAAPALWAEIRRTNPEIDSQMERARVRREHPREHDLKVVADLFEVIESGRKTFELRLNDRDYRVGDVLRLRAWDGSSYTGQECRVDVTYLIDGERFGGLLPNYVVMAIKLQR